MDARRLNTEEPFAIPLTDKWLLKFLAQHTLYMINYLCRIKTYSHSPSAKYDCVNHRSHFMRKHIFSLLIIFHYSGAEE